MPELSIAQKFAVWTIPVLFAITVHETAHGWVARYFGDHTASMLGRLTLNPLKHIDPIGTILVPALMMLLTGFIFGWAKPVPVISRNLHNPRRDMVYVAAAGPFANLLMAIFWALVLKLGFVLLPDSQWIGLPLLLAGGAGVWINLILMTLNLLPLPPLDGGRILSGLLPPEANRIFERIEPYGFLILIVLLVTGALGMLLSPLLQSTLNAIATVLAIPDLMIVINFLLAGGK